MNKRKIHRIYLFYVPICPLYLLAKASNAFTCRATAMRPLIFSWPRKKAPSADILPAASESSVSSEQWMLTSGLAGPVSAGGASWERLGGQ